MQYKKKLEGQGGGPVFVEDLSVMIEAEFGPLNGRAPTDFFTGLPLKFDKKNKLVSPCVIHRYSVGLYIVEHQDGTRHTVRGAMIKGNLIFTTLAVALARYTSSAPTMSCLLESMKNRRSDPQATSVSCLVPGKTSGARSLQRIPANHTKRGKKMRALCRIMQACTTADQVFPHLRKHRFDRVKLTNAQIVQSLLRLKNYLKVLENCNGKDIFVPFQSMSLSTIPPADPDELLERTKDLPLVDANLNSSSISPRLSAVPPKAKYGKPVDQELKQTLYNIVVDMHQDRNGGEEWLPQGPDACFSFLTGEDNSQWSFEEVSRPHRAYIRHTVQRSRRLLLTLYKR